MMTDMSATKIGPGYYHYRGNEIYRETEGDYAGWWKIGPTLERAECEGLRYEFTNEFQTKREAMACIDASADPPAGY